MSGKLCAIAALFHRKQPPVTIYRTVSGPENGSVCFGEVLGSFRFSKAYSWLHDLYTLTNITGVTKYRGMRWAGHVTGVGDRTDA